MNNSLSIKSTWLVANEFGDEIITFSELINISRNKNIPISLPDHQFITANFWELYTYFITETLWKKKEHNNMKDGKITAKWLDVINKKIIPWVFHHIENFLHIPLEKAFRENEGLSKFQHIYDKYKEFWTNKYSEIKYIEDVKEYIEFISSLFDKRDDKDTKNSRIVKSHKREVLNSFVAYHEQEGEFEDLDRNYEEFQDIIKNIYERLPGEYKDKIWFEDRKKTDSTRIQKLLAKKSTNPSETNTDDFWNRFVILEENPEEIKKISKILSDTITEELIKRSKHFDKQLQIANHWWFTEEGTIINKQKHLTNKWFEVTIESVPTNTRFPTTKYEGKYIDSKNKVDKIPFEIQILDKAGALEEWRSGRAFYHAKKSINQTTRSYTKISKKRIGENIKRWLSYQMKCYKEDLQKIEKLEESRSLWNSKRKFLEERYKKIIIPWSRMIVEFPKEWAYENIAINSQLINDKHIEEITEWYIYYLIERWEITNFYPQSNKKEKEITNWEYFIPIETAVIKRSSNIDQYELKKSKVWWLEFIPKLGQKLSQTLQWEKEKDYSEIETTIMNTWMKILYSLWVSWQEEEKTNPSKQKNKIDLSKQKAKKISMQNLLLLYYLDLILNWKFESWEHKQYKEYYEERISEVFKLQKTSS